MKASQSVFLLTALFIASACSAESEKHLGCDWVIPTEFHKVYEGYYSNLDEGVDLEKLQLGTISFIAYSPSKQDNHSDTDNDMLELAHKSQPTDTYKYISLFVRSHRLGRTNMLAQLLIIKNDKAIQMIGLIKDDAITLTSGCAELSQVEQHYDVLEQVKNGFSDFLNSEHDMDVLVPQA